MYPTIQHCWRMLYTVLRMANPSISDGPSDKTSFISELHKIILAKGQRHIICSLNRLNQHILLQCILTHYVLHNYKVSRSSVEWFQWSCAEELFWAVSWSKFKKGHFSQKKQWIRISCGYAHQHIKSFITTKFHEILLSGFRGVILTNCIRGIFHFGQISKLKKKSKIPREKNWIICITKKFQEILLSCADKRNRTDGLTDWRVKNIIPSATRCVGYFTLTCNTLCGMLTYISCIWTSLCRMFT